MYLEIPSKIGKKVGFHFYENILSETNLPLVHLLQNRILQKSSDVINGRPLKANLFQRGYFCKSEYPLFCQFWGNF